MTYRAEFWISVIREEDKCNSDWITLPLELHRDTVDLAWVNNLKVSVEILHDRLQRFLRSLKQLDVANNAYHLGLQVLQASRTHQMRSNLSIFARKQLHGVFGNIRRRPLASKAPTFAAREDKYQYSREVGVEHVRHENGSSS
jgi:hypothetical protein